MPSPEKDDDYFNSKKPCLSVLINVPSKEQERLLATVNAAMQIG
jgi:hypothetical protein